MAADALFTHDAQGRMLRVNEPGGAPAPRFFLGRTREGHVWRFRHDVPDAVIEALTAQCVCEPADEIATQPARLTDYERILITHGPITESYAGPEFCFPQEITHPAGNTATRLTLALADALAPHFAWIIPELNDAAPAWGVRVNGVVVSVCFSSRTTPQADEAGVETVQGHRGAGHAPAVVAAWAAAIRALGRVPLYGTTWDNIASRRVAHKLGLIAFGAVLHLQ
jgi:RimJ/RimL family protein N-acetyltransferase